MAQPLQSTSGQWPKSADAETKASTPNAPTPPTGMPAAVGTRLRAMDWLGNYQLLRRLGGGGMAEVFLARSALGGGVEKLVAFKTALPQFGPDTRLGALFLNEAKVSATFEHPNVIQVFDFGEAAGRPYLAMEFVRGRDLLHILAKLRARPNPMPVPVPVAVAIGIEICKALEYVHKKCGLDGRPLELVHRDVSPGNILLSARGEVKLMDFGVVAARGNERSDLHVGKSAYIAPEQRLGHWPSPLWDIYALGVTLRELVTLEPGRPPRPAASTLNPAVPKELDEILDSATSEDALTRCRGAGHLRCELESLQMTVGRADLGQYLRDVFGEELNDEEKHDHALIAKCRAEGNGRGEARENPLLRPFNAVRRRIASSRLYMDHRRKIAVGGALVAVAVAALGVGLQQQHKRAVAIDRELEQVDQALASGRWITSGDSALSHLISLEKLSPKDPRAKARREKIADKLVALGKLALARHDDAEALVHFEGALVAQPLLFEAHEQITLLRERAQATARAQAKESPP